MQSEFTIAEREEMLRKMEAASKTFYAAAVSCGYHQFIEITGFMNMMTKVCSRMHEDGVDFATTSLSLQDHEAAYLAEKLDCIFGSALTNPEIRQTFLESLAAHGGWEAESAI